MSDISTNKILFNYMKYFTNTISDNLEDILQYKNTSVIDKNTSVIDKNNSSIILKKIYTIFQNNSDYSQSLNFISIGSASNIEHKYYSVLPPKDNHQIPTFLYNILIDPYIKYNYINIFLIDERIEDIPYIINNSSFQFEKKNECWNYKNINIYSYKNNINNYEKELHYLVKIYNILSFNGKLIVNDYSGLEIDRIFEYLFYKYDNTISHCAKT